MVRRSTLLVKSSLSDGRWSDRATRLEEKQLPRPAILHSHRFVRFIDLDHLDTGHSVTLAKNYGDYPMYRLTRAR